MKLKFSLIVWAISILLISVAALSYRSNIVEPKDMDKTCKNAYVVNIGSQWWENKETRDFFMKYPDYDTMEEHSELIVLVTATAEREYKERCILTKVSVDQVLKGVCSQPYVLVYEPASIYSFGEAESWEDIYEDGYAEDDKYISAVYVSESCRAPDMHATAK